MNLTKIKTIIGFSIIAFSTAHAMNHHPHTSNMKHSMAKQSSLVLNEAGTDPFATIQEAINHLENDSSTDWSKVNFEKLRKHLIEMEDVTMNVDVFEENIIGGFKALITPNSARALKSLHNVLKNHPRQLSAESGWVMQVNDVSDGKFWISVVSTNKLEVAKVRGLGYIGVMAYGNHHQTHHWDMVRGENPHAGHGMKH